MVEVAATSHSRSLQELLKPDETEPRKIAYS